MSLENLFHLFPQKKIRPYDGMSVTADVWEKAHETHTLGLQSHNLFFHGAGILTGLEVVSSDPPDRLVYILPGVAVDALGRVIVLPQAVAYDMGNDSEGQLYFLLSYRETMPSAGEGVGSEPAYTQSQFVLTARPSLPQEPVVELARITRSDRNASVKDAVDTLRPQADEIDLRYRRTLALSSSLLIPAAVIASGSGKNRNAAEGLANLAQAVRPAGRFQLVVEDQLPLNQNVVNYAALFLFIDGDVKLSASQIKGLKSYLEKGGTLVIECANEKSRTSAMELAGKLEIGLTNVEKGHALLCQPNLFAVPPAGYQPSGELLAGDGVLVSTFNYPRVWAGEAANGLPDRAQIRAAMEWGENLLQWIADRQVNGTSEG